MADHQSQITSTVAPSDPASAAGSKKSKPGKAERAARRAATGSQAGAPASSSKASAFASSVAAPKPQPGKFPVVFQTGAGEPSRDEFFGLDPDVVSSTLGGFAPRFKDHMRYSEFLSYSEYDDDDFTKQLTSAGLLRLAQQLVHAHVNMGLPQGDFAPVASTEVRVPGSMSAAISQFGELAVPALGTRFLLKDYASSVKSLIWAAHCAANEDNVQAVISRSWLPVSKTDGHTKQIIATRLNAILKIAEIQYDASTLEKYVLSGNRPDSWDQLKVLLGDTEKRQQRFDFLFKSHKDAPEFVTSFTSNGHLAILKELGLDWYMPSAAHVDWSFNPKETFSSVSDEWARKSATYAQFFELASSQTNRTAATGSQSQFAIVDTRDSVTVVKARLALSAPEFSLAACFPATVCLSEPCLRNVVVTTPLSVTQRATEFVQLDWR
uniref:Coat protein n=1 Tax=Nigrospora oryzae partitivirus 1 TaxID=2269000 RepID=A0A345D7G5_9VIRU|nr:coat protein [Nigrospora oryzae partitivirus 1]